MVTRTVTAAPGQDLLEGMVEQRLAGDPLSRSRVLRWLGAGVFGMAVGGLLPKGARADVATITASCAMSSKSPCYGYSLCGGLCTACCRSDIAYCDPHCNGGYLGCPNGSVCWYSCVNTYMHRCCDCRGSSGPCICHFITGRC